MSRPIIKYHNIETDEIIEREMNDEEYEQYELDLSAELSRSEKKFEQIAAREALLSKLGITEEEAQLLLNGEA